MKNFLKELIYFFKTLLPPRGTVVLMYHSVGDNSAFFTVAPNMFERQLQYIADKKHRVIVTFDDGYEDNYTIAFPLLKKYNISASIFIATSFIGRSRTLRSGNTFPMLSWQQIEEMKTSGLVEFFPHSHTHPKLTELSLDEAEQEIRKSREIIPGDLFAYPYGYYNSTIIDFLKKQGFIMAYTVQSGVVTSSTDPFLIPRNSVDSHVTFSMFRGIIQRGRIR